MGEDKEEKEDFKLIWSEAESVTGERQNNYFSRRVP